MNLATLGVVLAVGMLLTACSSADPKTGAAGPATVRACAVANTVADTCVMRQDNQGNRIQVCHLYVGVLPSGEPYVYPYRLRVPRGAVTIDKRRLVWHTSGGDLRFELSDGPTELKNKPQEFPNGGPTDDIDGTNPGTIAARRYRIENNFVNSDNPYGIRFKQRLANGTIVSHHCDPIIINAESD